ncbi:MAG TPA: hypothetical protein VJR04_15000 [Terriglobales bacterium]|nr:hypothetical protein [Terriglobales bacterium]
MLADECYSAAAKSAAAPSATAEGSVAPWIHRRGPIDEPEDDQKNVDALKALVND